MPVRRQFKQFTYATNVELCLSLSSENTVKTKIWCAIATCILIAIIEKDGASFTIPRTLRFFTFGTEPAFGHRLGRGC
jgi:hypothetical protein